MVQLRSQESHKKKTSKPTGAQHFAAKYEMSRIYLPFVGESLVAAIRRKSTVTLEQLNYDS